MKTPAVSCLIPSRGRPGKLFTAIHTINNSCSSMDNIEILIRLDDDDELTHKYISTIKAFPNVTVISGSRGQGYCSVSDFYSELAAIAKGQWCWFLLDDCLIGGRDFDLKMMAVPQSGYIIQPEISRVGGSTYPLWEGSNFPALPTRSWLNMGWDKLHHPLDTSVDQFYRKEHGWKTRFLEGITGWHLMHQEHDK